MNFKTMSPLTILIIVIVILVGTVGIIYAVGQLDIGGKVTVVSTISNLVPSSAELDWGPLTRGESKDVILQLHNNGEMATEALLIEYPDFPWSDLGIARSGELTAIPPNGDRDITFTLTVLPNTVNALYTFEILIGY